MFVRLSFSSCFFHRFCPHLSISSYATRGQGFAIHSKLPRNSLTDENITPRSIPQIRDSLPPTYTQILDNLNLVSLHLESKRGRIESPHITQKILSILSTCEKDIHAFYFLLDQLQKIEPNIVFSYFVIFSFYHAHQSNNPFFLKHLFQWITQIPGARAFYPRILLSNIFQHPPQDPHPSTPVSWQNLDSLISNRPGMVSRGTSSTRCTLERIEHSTGLYTDVIKAADPVPGESSALNQFGFDKNLLPSPLWVSELLRQHNLALEGSYCSTSLAFLERVKRDRKEGKNPSLTKLFKQLVEKNPSQYVFEQFFTYVEEQRIYKSKRELFSVMILSLRHCDQCMYQYHSHLLIEMLLKLVEGDWKDIVEGQGDREGMKERREAVETELVYLGQIVVRTICQELYMEHILYRERLLRWLDTLETMYKEDELRKLEGSQGRLDSLRHLRERLKEDMV